jgi:hypothetical protein
VPLHKQGVSRRRPGQEHSVSRCRRPPMSTINLVILGRRLIPQPQNVMQK